MTYLTELQGVMEIKKRHPHTKMSQSAQDETRTHTILRPLPPQSSVYTNFTTCAELRECAATCCAHPPSGQKKRAENETRTRDPDLGKVVLYQLSYFRILFVL